MSRGRLRKLAALEHRWLAPTEEKNIPLTYTLPVDYMMLTDQSVK